MPTHLKTLIVAATLVAGLAAASALYAHDSNGSKGSMTGPSMMGDGNMMGMTNMTGQMRQMMENCNKMMQGMVGDHESRMPGDQWRNEDPGLPKNDG